MGAFSFFTDLSERTAMEERLRDALAGAEEANRAKSAFLANMSHEIRTPMNAILGMTSLVLETALSQEQRELLEMVDASGKKLMTLLNDILDLSRIEAGKLSLAREPFSLRKTLDQVVRPLALSARQKDLFFTMDVDPELGDRFLGDAIRLSQVLLNLCSNALKFTSRGGISVDVRSEDPERPGLIRFSVTDTGVGIREDQKEKLFGYFSQLDQSRSKQFEGTGLGLAISRELVTAMNGRIWVESREGQGSTFKFTVLLELSEGQFAEKQGEEKDPPFRPAGRARRILLAEDNPVNAVFAERVLTSAGHAVVRASSGQEALDILLGKGPFDLVLMDVQMPGMDGLEAVKRIREGEQKGKNAFPWPPDRLCPREDRDLCLAAGWMTA
jgi:CheY-like chemotaxis protein